MKESDGSEVVALEDAKQADEGVPLYVTVQQAADIAGVSYGYMKELAENVLDPIPHIEVGRKKKLIRASAIPEWMEKREVKRDFQ